MPVLEDWDIQLDVDAVLRGQGANPQALRQRSPRLVAAAEKALQQARVLIQPLLLYEYFDIYEVRHTYIALERGPRLRGEALVQGMSSARQAVVMVCTIGSHLEELAMRSMPTDPVHGLRCMAPDRQPSKHWQMLPAGTWRRKLPARSGRRRFHSAPGWSAGAWPRASRRYSPCWMPLRSA